MLGIMWLSTYAYNSGMITIRQLLVISSVSSIIMFIMVISLLFKVKKMIKTGGEPPNFSEVKVVIPKAHIDNKMIRANDDVLIKNIVPTNPFRRCMFRISMEINASIEQLSISAIRFRDSKIIKNTIIKNLAAKEAYTIDTFALPNETINFKFDRDVDIKKMIIDELYVP
jgi:hypothetical protein